MALRARVAVGIALGALLALAAADLALPPPIPDLARTTATLVLAEDGTPLRAFPAADGVWRYPVAIDAVSPLYVAALTGYEDRWFFIHAGVNPAALLRAFAQAVWHRDVVSGGSTLTMQVARLIEPIPRTLPGKLKQIVRALQIERRLSKAEVLTLYLNLAPFGGNVEGVAAASWAYLGKAPRELSHAEAALLAVLPQAPSRLRPDRHPDAARGARDKVLARLADLGIWSRAEFDEAAAEPVVARRLKPPMTAALFAERVRRQRPGAGAITTTIDARLQRVAERRVAAHLAALPERTSAAVLVVDNQSLATRVYVGSARFGDSARLGHVDMVQATRSPGSTLKPFIYALALDGGLIHSASLLVDAPQDFDGWRPTNFGDAFLGPVAASDALKRSLNVPAVDLLERVTPGRFAARLAHVGLILALPDGAEPNLALALGGTGTSLEQLIGAYAAFARDGTAAAPRFYPDAPLAPRRFASVGASWIVRDMLAAGGRPGDGIAGLDVSTRAGLAWKTGTSYGFRDSWAIGVTPRYTLGVWIGRPDGTPLPGQYGAITALPLLVTLADALPKASGDTRFPPAPQSVSARDICWPLGGPLGETPADACARMHRAWVLDGVVPPTLADRRARASEGLVQTVLVDAASELRVRPDCAAADATRIVTLARWPARLSPWLDSSGVGVVPAWSRACATPAAMPNAGRLAITAGVDGSVLRRAPRSAHPPTLDLAVVGADGEVSWLINDRLVGVSRGGAPLRYRFTDSGTQRIVALDQSGRFDRVTLEVID